VKIVAGIIADHRPIVRARIKRGKLEFSERGDLEFVVDTGFTGDILFPAELTEKLDLKFVSYDSFQLAADQTIALPVYRGQIMLARAMLEVEMMPGDALIGMSLLQAIGSRLILDFDRARFELRA